jgi:hypothetical protein
VFQPVILAGMVAIALSLTAAGAINTDAMFRKLVLTLLLCAGMAPIAAQRWPLLRPMIA